MKSNRSKQKNRKQPTGWRSRVGRVARVAGVAGALVTVAIVADGARRWVVAHPYFSVRAIEVEGLVALDREELLGRAGLAEGSSTWDVDSSLTSARILAHPRVRDVEVATVLPDRVAVRIEERTPVAVLLTGSRRVLVDDDGVLFEPTAADTLAALPLVTGEIAEGTVRGSWSSAARLRTVTELLRRWHARGGWPEVSEIRFEASGDVVVHPVKPALTVRFRADELGSQCSRLDTVWERWRGIEDLIRAIDLTVPGQAILALHEVDATGARTKI